MSPSRLAPVLFVVGVLVSAPRRSFATTACETLTSLASRGTAITLARAVGPGEFAQDEAQRGRQSAVPEPLPAFCRVAATLTPSTDSEIRIEVWMPASGWNGKLQAVGNGGWTGSINYGAMGDALRRGYATSSTDTGHIGGTGSFALGHPEKLTDFGSRAVHEMTMNAKRIVAAYYDRGPERSYWNGCSAGGRQGLKEAQRYPMDYDGIIAGAPASDWTGRSAQALRVGQVAHREEGSYIPPEKYAAIHAAVLEKCDALDGAKDGLLEDPTRCSFDPGVLTCQGADGPNCLTPAQVETARQIYATTKNPKTGRAIPGLQPGSELGWSTWTGPRPFGIAVDHFKYVVFRDAGWDPRAFVFERDIVRAEEVDQGTINALDPTIEPFLARGGKLIQYHGWSDPQIAPGSSVQYFDSVAREIAARRDLGSSYRLFMVPGMSHCRGGEGTDVFDAVHALEQWVEKKTAPDRIPASRVRDGKIDRTRPLCPFPQVAQYKGSGSVDEAANFQCRMRR